MCENKVNHNDFEVTEEGYYIAGDDYPSIEHVIPISKGGTHTWDNVKLAHRKCNNLKSDKVI
ncbi:HNH endonuclease [Virgibacillus sp. SK37]|uniref:HNH endonuclease n=1 Tax=Virgibacillus sp. SK37 TaxID=403957 RepID=UPI001B301D1C|nr:HNH endonuclease [Virgibacillus sp. SK37]